MGLKDRLFDKRNEVFKVLECETGRGLLEMDEHLSIDYLVEIKTEELDETLKKLTEKMNALGVSVYTLKEQIEDQIAEGNDTVAIDIFCMIDLEEV